MISARGSSIFSPDVLQTPGGRTPETHKIVKDNLRIKHSEGRRMTNDQTERQTDAITGSSLRIRLIRAIFSAVTLLIMAGSSPLADGQQGAPLGKYLKPDGTLNIPKGYSGTINPAGWRLVSPAGRAPRFTPVSGPADIAWDDRFCLVKPDGNVSAIAVSGTDVYIGGDFPYIGGDTANFIIKWNGRSWSTLGTGIGGGVKAIAVSGTDVYVGGYFIKAGGVPANNIAKWDGSSWSALGSGMSDGVLTIGISGSTVYAGGNFLFAGDSLVDYIAQWDGTKWSSMGSGMDGEVMSIVTTDSTVYAGGFFIYAGGDSVHYAAMWNGSSWLPLYLGFNGPVYSLALNQTGLYAGGLFTAYRRKILAGILVNQSAPHVARFTGGWSALGTGTNNVVYSVAIQDTDLYIGGAFDTAGGVRANGVAEWNGSSWQGLDSGMGGSFPDVYVLGISGTDLYAGGSFTMAGQDSAVYIAKYNGNVWAPLGFGLNGPVRALAAIGADLYAGGVFTTAGGVIVNHIARWDGSSWTPLGSGMNNVVLAMAVNGTTLYAGGAFTTAGGTSANYIAKWDGSSWSALGTGMNNEVTALAASGTDLYAAGPFKTAGGGPANQIARWDGVAWSALGSGFGQSGLAQSLAAVPNSRGGTDVYAGGQFDTAGGVIAHNIAKWDGGHWSALGSGANSNVGALLIDTSSPGRQALYAGGLFFFMDSIVVNHIAKWDDSTWSALGTGMPSYTVAGLTRNRNDVYAVGLFDTAGGFYAPNIARWDGGIWQPLGSGLDNIEYAVTVCGDGLYAGGYSIHAGGGQPSLYIARWKLPPPPIPLDCGHQPGWNLISAPVVPSNDSVSALFPDATTSAFDYTSGGYQVSPTLAQGTGYWLRFPSSSTDTITGEPILQDTLPVLQGWNLVGSISNAVAVTAITSVPPGMVTSNFFAYNGGYTIADSIHPGSGYWVKVSGSGQLVLSSSGSAPAQRIRIVQTADAPPSPPNDGMTSGADRRKPARYALHQNYPNPFNPTTTIRYDLPVEAHVTLKIYDVLGEEVQTLVNGTEAAGYKSVEWNSTNKGGMALPSGVYFYRLEATGAGRPGTTFTQIRKSLLIK